MLERGEIRRPTQMNCANVAESARRLPTARRRSAYRPSPRPSKCWASSRNMSSRPARPEAHRPYRS